MNLNVFKKVRSQAEKVGELGAKSLKEIAKLRQPFPDDSKFKGSMAEDNLDTKVNGGSDYTDVQQLFRHQFPTVTRQLLGRRYNAVDKITRFVLPNGLDQAADEVLAVLGKTASHLANTDKVLFATGEKDLKALQQDTARASRASHAMTELNKYLAALQGGLSGMAGMVGVASDLPLSTILALKTIFEIGHTYGFELNDEEDERAVYQSFANTDLGLMAEKQTIFIGLQALKQILKSGDFSQLQGFLSTEHQFDEFKSFFTDADGQLKWQALSMLKNLRVLRYVTPVVGGVVGAYYGVRLIDDVAVHAQTIFANARVYLNAHPDEHISILDAYQRQQQSGAPLLVFGKADVVESNQIQLENKVVTTESTISPHSTPKTQVKKEAKIAQDDAKTESKETEQVPPKMPLKDTKTADAETGTATKNKPEKE